MGESLSDRLKRESPLEWRIAELEDALIRVESERDEAREAIARILTACDEPCTRISCALDSDELQDALNKARAIGGEGE